MGQVMKTQKPLFGLLLACSMVACTQTTSDPGALPDENADNEASALDAEGGAFSEVDEQPLFADPAVRELADFEAAPTEMMDAPGADLPDMKSYHIALLWGHLPKPADASAADPDPAPVDWTGSVSVDKGAIGVERKLAFDARDHLERRTDRQSVAFVSHTMPFVDGLYLRVVVPAGGSQVLHFDTDALKTDIDLSKLGSEIVNAERLGDGRNGLAYIGYADKRDCARGVLFGRWVKHRPAMGAFRGRVLGGDGDTIGHIRGIWGHAPKKDKNLFFGKYIATDGKTRGLFGGVYGDGKAVGIWGTKNPADAGGLQLVYSDGYDKGDGRGVFLGRWSEKCGE